MKVLKLPRASRAQIEAWMRGGYPYETCGLLIGRKGTAEIDVLDVAFARNVNEKRSRDRFELDPQDFFAVYERACNEGLDVVGCWHSHPDHPARPSKTDRESAFPGWTYIIGSVVREGVQELRSFYFDGERFSEQLIEGASDRIPAGRV
jgi:proteasome lid subunit RPN8/RPN11